MAWPASPSIDPDMRYLITGVDTEVGKTHIAVGLLSTAVKSGIRCVGIKPVESGCGTQPSGSEDGMRLATAAGQAAPRSALMRLRAPVAPPLAAENEGRQIQFDQLMDESRAYMADQELALVEGAGGLLSPMTWQHTALDMAKALETRVIVVAADRLGMIGHVQLVLSALRHAGLTVDGVVVNQCSAQTGNDDSVGTNAQSLRKLAKMPSVFEIPFCPDLEIAAKALRPLLTHLMEIHQ